MSHFESSVRVPMLVNYPKRFKPHRVTQSVSTLDLPTICDLIGTKPAPYLPMDGISMLPHLEGREGHDKVSAEYTGEGTVRPMMMIRRGPWKYITCPADEPQLYNLERDPKELDNLSRFKKIPLRPRKRRRLSRRLRSLRLRPMRSGTLKPSWIRCLRRSDPAGSWRIHQLGL
ncbi:alkaline-phosphatase-like protein [Ilyonectria destructans]|nr:alkaline-phosphatase-like protein [Ilyonectria destructans]